MKNILYSLKVNIVKVDLQNMENNRYHITLSNNASIVVSDYHENIIHDGYTESTLTTIELLKYKEKIIIFLFLEI